MHALNKVSAYDEKISRAGEVLVKIRASNVPVVWAFLTSLEKTVNDDIMKSINAMPTKIFRNPLLSKSASLLKIRKIINKIKKEEINCINKLNL